MARPSRHNECRDRAGGPPRQSRLRSASFTERGVHFGLAAVADRPCDGVAGGNGAVPRVSDSGPPPVRKPSLRHRDALREGAELAYRDNT